MSKITNDDLTRMLNWMLYCCTHMAYQVLVAKLMEFGLLNTMTDGRTIAPCAPL